MTKDCQNCGHNLTHGCHFVSCQKQSHWIAIGEGLLNLIKAGKLEAQLNKEQRSHLDDLLYPRR